MEKYYHVKRASYLGYYMIHIEFENGEQRILDCNSWLNEDMGDFEDLKNEELFKQFSIERGLLVWPNGYDLAPEYTYHNSKPVVFNKDELSYTVRSIR